MSYFLPYQQDWINDKSRYKICEKSRRTGMTFAQSWEDVEDAANGLYDVWLSSADLSASSEYIYYCKDWIKILKIAADDLGEIVIDKDKDVTAHVIKFSNGKRINALSSSPTAFRSKGGKIVLDEFAHHKDQTELWKAAQPSALWGYPIRIISTHNGSNSKFNEFVVATKENKLKWSLHTINIELAVAQGLADKIRKKNLTEAERREFIEEIKQGLDQRTLDEEYMCIPNDSNSLFIPYELIAPCEDKELKLASYNDTDELYLGYDVARRGHLSVIWIIKKINSIKITADILLLENMKFSDQRTILYDLLDKPNVRRVCIDNTGLGMQLAEEAHEKYPSKVEAVTFTSSTKEKLASHLRNQMEDKNFIIPFDTKIRDDFYKVRKEVTSSGNIRFSASDKKDADGEQSHADRFWAAALCLEAARTNFGAPFAASASMSNFKNELQGY